VGVAQGELIYYELLHRCNCVTFRKYTFNRDACACACVPRIGARRGQEYRYRTTPRPCASSRASFPARQFLSHAFESSRERKRETVTVFPLATRALPVVFLQITNETAVRAVRLTEAGRESITTAHRHRSTDNVSSWIRGRSAAAESRYHC